MNRFTLIIIMTSIMALGCSTNETSWKVDSPNGGLSFVLEITSLDQEPAIKYQIESGLAGEPTIVIEKSPMGMEINNSTLEVTKFLSKSGVRNVSNMIQVPHGKANTLNDHYNEQIFKFQTNRDFVLSVRVRAYDDGVAFKYGLEGDTNEDLTITKELTGFKLPTGNAWIQPYDTVTKWTPAYEQPYHSNMPIGTNSPNAGGWCFPLLAETSNHWLLITEAGLDGTYAGTHLEQNSEDGLYKIRFPETTEAEGLGDATPSIKLPWRSPWRAIHIGSELATIVSADLVSKLANEPLDQNFDWVKPGSVSWSWWSDHDSPQNPEALRDFIDLAADMGWEYSLIDANWNFFPEEELLSLIEYANEKNVGIWLWYNSGGPHNTVEEAPRDRMHERDVRRKEFSQLQSWGVKGVKIDFFQSDKQDIIQQYIDILEDAAKYEIMINFHGCTIPRGWSRTYPHLLTIEAVRGAETYSFNGDWPMQAPVQNTIYPFTRNVIGSMDYTPVTFSDQAYPHITTLAHELALSVVFESAAQHFADRVEAYTSLPETTKNFLKQVPTTWDQTKLIEGYPGREIIIARRKSATWYIAGINGENTSKDFEIDLSFIDGVPMRYAVIGDDGKGGFFDQEEQSQQINVAMLPFGGFVAIIEESPRQ